MQADQTAFENLYYRCQPWRAKRRLAGCGGADEEKREDHGKMPPGSLGLGDEGRRCFSMGMGRWYRNGREV
ncbi:hypothetical protein [Thiolapillus sp.]|uniref:hypothetical protein n=1 Tax=Thiolapillus sp. TaxID=2017437 RepID=UPI0025CC6C6A|nr:hypothetical protein [Thiolapillus sp.]